MVAIARGPAPCTPMPQNVCQLLQAAASAPTPRQGAQSAIAQNTVVAATAVRRRLGSVVNPEGTDLKYKQIAPMTCPA